MRSTKSTALRRVLVVFLAVFFVVTLGGAGVGVAKEYMVAGSGMAEGDPGDGHDSSGGSGGSIGELGGSGASTRPDSGDDEAELFVFLPFFGSRNQVLILVIEARFGTVRIEVIEGGMR